ncbi:MAG: cell division protein ZapA [Vallitaleaceae bacterium]|jgi:cell division protein ZapA|nr:cell division protein ZapA [Vallitaleaceae bacterium]
MSPANNTKVLIGGNVYTLSGDESEEYIQRVALYINNKLDEIKQSDNAKQLNTRLLSVLLEINIADDYFKTKEQIQTLEGTLSSKDQEIRKVEQEKTELLTKIVAMDHEKEVLNETIEALKAEILGYKSELNEYLEMFDDTK